jgi:pectate lyase
MTDSGTITLRDSIIKLSGNYTFSRGSLLLLDNVEISGTNKFVYSSGLTSTISTLSNLLIDYGITFSYDPWRPYKNLIYMNDNTSSIWLDGCTLYSTRTGLQLTQGRLMLENNLTFTSEARYDAEAMVLNNAVDMRIFPGSTVNVYGRLRLDP